MAKSSPGNHQLVRNWRVLEDYTASDHMYITFTVVPPKARCNTIGLTGAPVVGWSVKKLDPKVLGVFWDLVGAPPRLPAAVTPNCYADRLNHLDDSM